MMMLPVINMNLSGRSSMMLGVAMKGLPRRCGESTENSSAVRSLGAYPANLVCPGNDYSYH